MLISHKNRFIFIHIYKNAGTSITTALKPFALNRWAWIINRGLKQLNASTRFDPQPFHDHAKATEIIDTMGRSSFNAYFSFAIVRNPWDWQVSLYKFTLKDTHHPQHDLVKNLGSFDNYIRWRCHGEEEFQKDFIYSKEGELLVDFVGRYENINADFEKICSRIGISASLPKLNVSNTKPYQQFYTPETNELVRRTFDPDVTLFRYSF